MPNNIDKPLYERCGSDNCGICGDQLKIRIISLEIESQTVWLSSTKSFCSWMQISYRGFLWIILEWAW